MDTEEIYRSMKNNIENVSGVYINSGGDMALRLYAVAAEIFTLWTQVDWLKRQSFPQTATDSFLDKHAALRSLERRAGLRAVGYIRFELLGAREQELTVPAGTVCLSAGGLEFITDFDAAIPAGELFCVSRATARLPGSFGNVPADSVYQMALAPLGVARCYNPAAFSGGSDLEDDLSLRARVLDSYARLPNGSNAAYYESVALNTDGVSAIMVIPRARGLGTVDLVVATDGGAASGEIIASLESRLEKEREICVDVRVLAPETVTVNVAVNIKVAEGYDGETVAGKVRLALAGLFDGKLLGKDLPRVRLGSVIYAVEGVSNYTIQTPGGDLSVLPTQLPVAGNITVTRS